MFLCAQTGLSCWSQISVAVIQQNFDWALYESPFHLCLAMGGISTITAHVIVADAFTATNVHESICLRFHPLTRMFTLVQITTLSMLSRPIRTWLCRFFKYTNDCEKHLFSWCISTMVEQDIYGYCL